MGGIYGETKMLRNYNREDVQVFVAGEKAAQGYMNGYYESQGLDIDRSIACKQYDLTVTYSDKTKMIEEKFRDTNYGDLLIEMFQCIEFVELGWFYHTTADYLNYVICNTDWKPYRLYSIKWNNFKPWLFGYLKMHPRPFTVLSPKGIGLSLNFSIRWTEIPDNLYKLSEIK
jgi:hypothetical protein